VEVNKKSAPQREVLSIERTGSWGKVEYRHRLTCGHTEVRKRPSSAPKIACTLCVIAESKAVELRALTQPRKQELEPLPDSPDVIADDIAEAELEIQKLRGALASFLSCSPEAIDVVMEVDEEGKLEAQYVHVFLDIYTAKNVVAKKQ
jgi:hypothetical protein